MTLALGHGSVRDMLSHVGSHEISEWMVYENLNGPLDSRWRDDILAGVNELLQTGNRIAGAQGKRNPVPEPKAVPRPWELAEYFEKQKRKGVA